MPCVRAPMGRRYQHPRAKRRQRGSKFPVSDCFIEPPKSHAATDAHPSQMHMYPTQVDQRAPSAAGFRTPRCSLHTPAHRMPYSHHHAAPAVRCKSYLISEEEALQKKKEMSCHHHRPPPVGPQRPHPLGRFILHTQTDRRFLAREISFRFVILRPLS